jgi:hypothetical protein
VKKSPILLTVKDRNSESHRKAMYLKATMRSTIITNDGSIRLPKGADKDGDGKDDESVVVKLNRGTAFRKITIDLSRSGESPELPEPKPEFKGEDGITHTLLDYRVTSDASGDTADGHTTIYKIKLIIIYQLSKKPDLTKGIPYGRLPYRGTAYGIDKIKPLFVDGMVK